MKVDVVELESQELELEQRLEEAEAEREIAWTMFYPPVDLEDEPLEKDIKAVDFTAEAYSMVCKTKCSYADAEVYVGQLIFRNKFYNNKFEDLILRHGIFKLVTKV